MPWPPELVKFLRIGRVEGNDIVLDDLRVSSRHARLMVVAGSRGLIEDLGSSNGTFLNSVDSRVTRLTSTFKIRHDLLRKSWPFRPPAPGGPACEARPQPGQPRRRRALPEPATQGASRRRRSPHRPGRQLRRRKSLAPGGVVSTRAGVPDRLDSGRQAAAAVTEANWASVARRSPRRHSRSPSPRSGSVARSPSRSSRRLLAQAPRKPTCESSLISLGSRLGRSRRGLRWVALDAGHRLLGLRAQWSVVSDVGRYGDGLDRGLLLGLLIWNSGQELADSRPGLARMPGAHGRARRLVWPLAGKGLPLTWPLGHAPTLGLRGCAAARVAPSSRREAASAESAPDAISPKTSSRRNRTDGHHGRRHGTGFDAHRHGGRSGARIRQARIIDPRTFSLERASSMDILPRDRRRFREPIPRVEFHPKPGELEGRRSAPAVAAVRRYRLDRCSEDGLVTIGFQPWEGIELAGGRYQNHRQAGRRRHGVRLPRPGPEHRFRSRHQGPAPGDDGRPRIRRPLHP